MRIFICKKALDETGDLYLAGNSGQPVSGMECVIVKYTQGTPPAWEAAPASTAFIPEAGGRDSSTAANLLLALLAPAGAIALLRARGKKGRSLFLSHFPG